MLDLNQLAVFIRVVDEGSFTSAGKVLGMPKSRVSRMVADLEASIGCRLLQRSTRQLHLTEVGAEYYDGCRGLLSGIAAVHERVSDHAHDAHGLLRIAVPMFAGSGVMGHYLARYQQQYPDVRLEIVHTERQINLIEEGFDIGVYVGELPDSSLIARTLMKSDSVLCASPRYLSTVSTPKSPEDLSQLRCVKVGEGSQAQVYQLAHRQTQHAITVKVEPNITTNLIASALNSALHGAGICELPYLLAGEYVLSGHLVPLFSDWELTPQALSLAYPSREYLPQKVRRFIDFIVSEVAELEKQLLQATSPEQQSVVFSRLLQPPA